MSHRRAHATRRRELPEYAALRAAPSRALPPDLAEHERSDTFATHRETIQRDLITRGREAADEGPQLVSLLAADGSGLLTMALPEDQGRCLLVFSTAFRAADYLQALDVPGPPLQYLASPPSKVVDLLRDVHASGIEQFALDRCPRCDVFTTIACDSVTSTDAAITAWAITKATEFARLDLYTEYVVGAARLGRFEVARDVALETVGHVSLEDPRPHLLLGQLALALGDRDLLGEARAFLQYLEFEEWMQHLDGLEQAGATGFEDRS